MQTSPSSVAEGRLGNVPLTGINREDRLSAAVEDMATAIKALQTSQQSLSSRIEKRLGDMENKLMCRIDHLSDKCDILQCDVDAMQDICDSVKEENEQLHNRVHTLEGQLDVVENQNRKSNLLFFGIPTTASEVWSDSEKKRQYSNSQNRDRPGIPRVILQKGVRGQATVSSCLMEAATGPDIERSVALTRAPVVRAIGREVWEGGGFSHHPSGNRNSARPS
ncbi:hypothetical protein ACOMHN_050680 [Nucella lapillus]